MGLVHTSENRPFQGPAMASLRFEAKCSLRQLVIFARLRPAVYPTCKAAVTPIRLVTPNAHERLTTCNEQLKQTNSKSYDLT